MSNFFDSEIIQSELQEIAELQKYIYERVISFGAMSREEKLVHIEKLSSLLEKQKIMYTRLSLSDDPKAIEMKENLNNSLQLLGFSSNTNMTVVFEQMEKTLKFLKNHIDNWQPSCYT